MTTRDQLERIRNVRFLREEKLRLQQLKKDDPLSKPIVGLGGTFLNRRDDVDDKQDLETERTKDHPEPERAEDENVALVSEQTEPTDGFERHDLYDWINELVDDEDVEPDPRVVLAAIKQEPERLMGFINNLGEKLTMDIIRDQTIELKLNQTEGAESGYDDMYEESSAGVEEQRRGQRAPTRSRRQAVVDPSSHFQSAFDHVRAAMEDVGEGDTAAASANIPQTRQIGKIADRTIVRLASLEDEIDKMIVLADTDPMTEEDTSDVEMFREPEPKQAPTNASSLKPKGTRPTTSPDIRRGRVSPSVGVKQGEVQGSKIGSDPLRQERNPEETQKTLSGISKGTRVQQSFEEALDKEDNDKEPWEKSRDRKKKRQKEREKDALDEAIVSQNKWKVMEDNPLSGKQVVGVYDDEHEAMTAAEEFETTENLDGNSTFTVEPPEGESFSGDYQARPSWRKYLDKGKRRKDASAVRSMIRKGYGLEENKITNLDRLLKEMMLVAGDETK